MFSTKRMEDRRFLVQIPHLKTTSGVGICRNTLLIFLIVALIFGVFAFLLVFNSPSSQLPIFTMLFKMLHVYSAFLKCNKLCSSCIFGVCVSLVLNLCANVCLQKAFSAQSNQLSKHMNDSVNTVQCQSLCLVLSSGMSHSYLPQFNGFSRYVGVQAV